MRQPFGEPQRGFVHSSFGGVWRDARRISAARAPAPETLADMKRRKVKARGEPDA